MGGSKLSKIWTSNQKSTTKSVSNKKSTKKPVSVESHKDYSDTSNLSNHVKICFSMTFSYNNDNTVSFKLSQETPIKFKDQTDLSDLTGSTSDKLEVTFDFKKYSFSRFFVGTRFSKHDSTRSTDSHILIRTVNPRYFYPGPTNPHEARSKRK